MKYTVSAEKVFRASHFIGLPGGRYEEPHEHDWRVRATVSAERLDENGLVMDFHVLEKRLGEVVRPLGEAGSINASEAFGGRVATTERIAEYVYGGLAGVLPGEVRLEEVMVWETVGCRAGYRGT